MTNGLVALAERVGAVGSHVYVSCSLRLARHLIQSKMLDEFGNLVPGGQGDFITKSCRGGEL